MVYLLKKKTPLAKEFRNLSLEPFVLLMKYDNQKISLITQPNPILMYLATGNSELLSGRCS
jgi:hypothetical protein